MERRTNEQTERLRRKLHEEINSHKVEIDRKVFKKTPHEKEMLKLAKAEHKLFIQKSDY